MEKDEDIDNYLEIIRDITDKSQRDKFIKPLQILLMRPLSLVFYNKLQTKKKDLKKALIEGILGTVLNENYDAKCLLNERTTQPLKELLGPTDIRELRSLLSNMRNNLDKTIDRFPD